MKTRIKLKILSPEGPIREEDCDYVTLETESGSLGIMRGHVPFAALLKGPKIIYRKENVHEAIDIGAGFAKVLPDSVTVFCQNK